MDDSWPWIPVFGVCDFRLLLFHGFEQWAGFCGDFLSADDGVPDSGGSYLSADLEGGRDLVLHGRCGDTGSRGDGDLSGSGKEAVRVLVMVPISFCIAKRVTGHGVNSSAN